MASDDDGRAFMTWLRENQDRLSALPLTDMLFEAWQEGQAQPVRGSDVTDGAGPDASCGCGEPITFFREEWLHVFNPELRGTDDHDARPGDPGSVNWNGYEDDEYEDNEEEARG